MSAVATEGTRRSFFGTSKVLTRPKVAVTMQIVKVQVPASGTSDASDYDRLEIVTEATRGSKKVFPSFLYRPEQFMSGFNPDAYQDYESNPALGKVPPGKARPLGEIFTIVYQNNIDPQINTPTKGKRAGLPTASKVTNLMAISGGTVESFMAIDAAIGAAASADGWEAKPEQVAEALNKYLGGLSKKPELIAILKQSEMNGVLQDRYEVDSWVGPVTAENHKNILDRIERAKDKEVGKQLTLGYQTK